MEKQQASLFSPISQGSCHRYTLVMNIIILSNPTLHGLHKRNKKMFTFARVFGNLVNTRRKAVYITSLLLPNSAYKNQNFTLFFYCENLDSRVLSYLAFFPVMHTPLSSVLLQLKLLRAFIFHVRFCSSFSDFLHQSVHFFLRREVTRNG